MGFILSGTEPFGGGSGFVPAGERTLTAAGYPVTLKKPKSLQAITVYGNDGGVGDRTVNLLDENILSTKGFTKRDDGTWTAGQAQPSFHWWENGGSITGQMTLYYRNIARQFLRFGYTDGTYSSYLSGQNGSFTTPTGKVVSFVELTKGAGVTLNPLIKDIMLVEGTVTALPKDSNGGIEYEPCGYKIPVVMGDVPAGYTLLEYIESTGTQCIDTGFVLDQDSVIELDAVVSKAANTAIMGARTSAAADNFTIFQGAAGEVGADFCNYNVNRYRYKFGDGERIAVRVSKENISFNNTAYSISSYNAFTTPGSCYLFSYYNQLPSYSYAKMRCYSFKIWQGDVLGRDLVPAKRNSDGTVGMYDTANNVFYANADESGDNFVAGAEIPNKTINLYSQKQLKYRGEKTLGEIIDNFKTEHSGIQYLDGTSHVRIPVAFGRYRANDQTDATPLLWSVADTQYMSSDGYVSLIVTSNLANKAFDAAEPTNPNSARAAYGSNRWSTSNIRQWLNSDDAAGSWFTAQTEYDAAPAYVNTNGFLHDFTAEEKAAIYSKENKLLLAALDGGGTEVVNDKIWLLSSYEAGYGGAERYPTGQSVFELFPDANARKTIGGAWLRSMRSDMPGTVHWINSSTGTLSTHYANTSRVIRPCINLSLSTSVVWDDELGAWEVITADALTVNIPAKTAVLTSDGTTTDISALQDWKQDFTLPKADELTVTADTTVEPSMIEIKYKGKR